MTKAYTINDFCKTYSISRSLFYRLKETGQAPKTMRLGGRILISSDAAEAWQQTMEA